MQTIAYYNGRYVDADKLLIPAHDAGFLLGATVAEQIRTFNGRPFWLSQHLQRIDRGRSIVGIEPPISPAGLYDVVNSIVAHNYPILAPECRGLRSDMGVTIFFTPGAYSAYGVASDGPTVGVHAYPLQFRYWAHRYCDGQRAIISSHTEVPTSCWPADVKCRSRMHYYLATKEAKNRDPQAVPILTDLDGFVSETPIANIIGYRESEGFVAPSERKTLPGISLAYVRQWAARFEIPFRHRDIPVSELTEFDEVMLTSTPFAVLPLVSIDGRSVGRGTPGRVFQRLLNEWSSDVDINIADQARQFIQR